LTLAGQGPAPGSSDGASAPPAASASAGAGVEGSCPAAADLHTYSINYVQGLEAVQIRKYFGNGWHVAEGDPEVLGLVNATVAANATEAAAARLQRL
jgi:hypothetical protein